MPAATGILQDAQDDAEKGPNPEHPAKSCSSCQSLFRVQQPQ